MPRAGWAGGMLSASKLYQSVSTSGPSATSKPMPTKTSSSSSRVWRDEVQVAPGHRAAVGSTSVRSSRSAASRADRSAASSVGRRSATTALEALRGPR